MYILYREAECQLKRFYKLKNLLYEDSLRSFGYKTQGKTTNRASGYIKYIIPFATYFRLPFSVSYHRNWVLILKNGNFFHLKNELSYTQLFNIDPTYTDFQSTYSRYAREGSLMLSLRHPHIVQLLAATCSDGNGSDAIPPKLIFEFMVSSNLTYFYFFI
jgi:hypothetical protein